MTCACTHECHLGETCDGPTTFAKQDEHPTVCCDCADECPESAR